MTGDVKRAVRVAERLRQELALRVRELRDPRIAGAVVTRVEMTDDLQLARVYVRQELGPATDLQQRALLEGLGAASGRLRRDVTQAARLRYAPNLRFFYDEAPDRVERIEELLREIDREREQGD